MLFRIQFSPKKPCLCKLFHKFQVWVCGEVGVDGGGVGVGGGGGGG